MLLSVGYAACDFADPRLSAEIHVAEIPALILAKGSKGSKGGERLREPSRGEVRDKDFGGPWRLLAVADPAEIDRVSTSDQGSRRHSGAVRTYGSSRRNGLPGSFRQR